MYRAYDVAKLEHKVSPDGKQAVIQGALTDYRATLESYTCPDFQERQLPCKHVYCFALLLGISLKVTGEMHQVRAQSFIPIITIQAK